MICSKNLYELTHKPQCFNHLIQDGYRYLDILYKGIVVCKAAFLISGHECVIHTHVSCWTSGVAKTLTRAFYKEFIPLIKAKNVKRLVALKEGKDDKQWAKFVQMFGFNKPVNCMYTERKL
jgi:hypothetical protein